MLMAIIGHMVWVGVVGGGDLRLGSEGILYHGLKFIKIILCT